MEYKIITPVPVLQDLLEITKWYDVQISGLSKRFESSLDKAIQKLSANPYAFSFSYYGCRKIKLKKFPYILFYKILDTEVKLYGIIHTKRKPGYISKKLRSRGI